VFDDAELDVMRRDIDAMKRAGAHGIVSGVLEPAGRSTAKRRRCWWTPPIRCRSRFIAPSTWRRSSSSAR
jgi:hypothetical protein